MKKLLLSLSLIIASLYAVSQTKIEREYRIRANNVPANAINYIDSLSLKKVKWYKEINSETSSYEAKFRLNKNKYSIEFDSLGKLEDIEVEINLKSLSNDTKNIICSQLDSIFEKCKITKIQKQYKTTALNLLMFISNKEATIKLNGYEIVVKGKENGSNNIYELFFSGDAILETKSVIVLKNTDHLEF